MAPAERNTVETGAIEAGPVRRRGSVGSARGFVVGGTAYLVAAAVVGGVHTGSAITRGWWLIAFLSLVGGLAQLLLGPGLIAVSRRSRAPTPPPRTTAAELVLWNGGTAAVAVADLAPSFIGVLAGGALLGMALLLFAADLHAVRAGAERAARGWIMAYRGLLAFLALSVLVGVLLAYLRGR